MWMKLIKNDTVSMLHALFPHCGTHGLHQCIAMLLILACVNLVLSLDCFVVIVVAVVVVVNGYHQKGKNR